MTAPKYIVSDSSGNEVAFSRHSTLWQSDPVKVLGFFDDEQVYDLNKNKVAYLLNSEVFSRNNDITITGRVTG